MVRRYEETVHVRVVPAQADPAVPIGCTMGAVRGGVDGVVVDGAAAVDGTVADGAVLDGAVAAGAQPVPDAFVWRGRLYVVREILGHWRERRAWWRTALDGGADSSPGQGDLLHAQVSRSPRHDLEQHVWRVEASPGRMHGTGVYDLACERPARDDPAHDDPADSWRIVRVAD